MKKNLITLTILLIVLSTFFIMVTVPKAQTNEWSEPQQLTTDPADDYYASIMQDSSGKIWLTWFRDDGGQDGTKLVYKTSSDGGASWSSPQVLASSIQSGAGTSLLQDSAGRIWLAWGCVKAGTTLTGAVFYCTSDNGGLSWSPIQRLTNYPADGNIPSLIEVSGEVWIVFKSHALSHNGDIWYMKTDNVGATWSDPIQLTSHSAEEFCPNAMLDSTGKIWVVWTRWMDGLWHEDIHYRTSIDNGVSWSSDQQLTTHPLLETHPFVIEDVSGKIFVFYEYRDGVTEDIWYKTTEDGGNTWSDYQELTTDVYSNGDPNAAIINSEFWAMWHSDKSGNMDIWMSKLSLPVLTATVDIDPDTLNLKSNGEWVTAYLELPESYHVEDIDTSTVMLNNTISVDSSAPTQIGDYDLDGVPDLMVKFDRAYVIEWLGAIDYSEETGKSCLITVSVTGNVLDVLFEGLDTIKMLHK